MTKHGLVSVMLLAMTGLAGCATSATEADRANAIEASTCSPGEGTDGKLQPRDIKWNGPQLQGTTLNGFRMNGVNLNGMRMNGLTLNGWTLNGTTLNGLTLNGTQFVGVATVAGAELRAQLSDGSSIAIHIDAVRENPNSAHADVALYEVSVGASREPLCGRTEDGAPVLATALANVWDEKTGARIDRPELFTFACQGGALYKCVDAGYKPWTGGAAADYHQACTRMVRADYCGDGTSYTADRTQIDIADGIGNQAFATASQSDFAFEAAWGPNGATCVAKTRYPLTTLPSCIVDRMSDACATAPRPAVDLVNRSSTANRCLR